MVAVLGINCFSHDTAACLLVDGQLVALGEEERFNRDQHTKQFPYQAIEFCLRSAGVPMAEVEAVAVAQKPLVDWARGTADALRRASGKRLGAQAFTDARLAAREWHFRRHFGYRGRLFRVGHHVAHAASTFFASPFDSAAVLTLDRGGDFLSTTLCVGEGRRLRTLATVRSPQSLGELYSALTAYLGFRPNADEGKVMGLAPYGTARFVPELASMVRLETDGLFRIDFRWFGWQREKGPVSRRFLERYGPPRVPESELTDRDKDLAFALQHTVEEAALHVARQLGRRVAEGNLCLAGGVALNSVMNERLANEAGFDRVFVQPASSDAGNALGAALWVWHHVMAQPRRWRLEHPFYGAGFTDAELAGALGAAGVAFRPVRDPAGEAARLVADGKVVGWFQGRAEIGPRALGARSILADPRRPDMRDIVNHQVKRREWFRPFAPSVLDEYGTEYFEGYRENQFMLFVQPVRPDKRDLVPAITHVDGTGRLQSVTESFHPSFHRLISEFHRLTGVPMVLNTSFNLRGEPMVHRPAEAVADYLASGMDAVLLGPYLAEKDGGTSSGTSRGPGEGARAPR